MPLTAVGVGLGCGVGLTAGTLFGSIESMLIGAVTGARGLFNWIAKPKGGSR